MLVWKRLYRVGFLISAFCLLQALCGCFVFQLLEKDEPFEYDEDAELYEEGEPKIRPGLYLKVTVTASGVKIHESAEEVNSEGSIQLPLAGTVKCEGLMLMEVQEAIAEAYKEFVINPQATVSFGYVPNAGMKSPWGSVLVMGKVMREGPVDMPSTRDLRLTRALMHAGGATQFGDKTKVRVSRRLKDGTLERFKVNVDKIARGRNDLDMKLKAGDVIWVPETWL